MTFDPWEDQLLTRDCPSVKKIVGPLVTFPIHRMPKTQVSHVALQTDTCDTLYVTKNTLTAYTIAIVQNSQALQYDQMHTALQTARNQASLETPLRAEELLTAHFNLAVLEDQKDTNKSPDAQKSTDTTQDAEPSA